MREFTISVFLLALCGRGWAQAGKVSAVTQPIAVAGLNDRAELKDAVRPKTGNISLLPLPTGTAIRMKLETVLDTSSSKAGDAFTGRVTEDIKLGDRSEIPAGASLGGHIARVPQPLRLRGKPMIQLRPECITLPNGVRFSISAFVVDTNKVNGTDVDDEGRITGSTHTTRDTVELGAGAGAEAIVGGIAAGGKGSLIGAHWRRRNTGSLVCPAQLCIDSCGGRNHF